MSQNAYITSAVAAGVLGGAAAYLAYRHYQNKHAEELPTEWRHVGTLKDLYVYPIKSCGPVVLSKAECSILGLRDGFLRDRVLMIIDEKNDHVHARTYPHLVTIRPSVKNSVLTLEYNNMDPISINLAEVISKQKVKKAQVWGTPVPVFECGDKANKWITSVLDRPSENFRLVLYASENSRKLRSKAVYKYFRFQKNDAGALPDESSYNLINEASVDDLNSRLKDCKASPRNFRPNFVLRGAKPYEEDDWNYVKIGENIFEVIKPCGRCIFVNIDPETGERNSKFEPLETLKRYRQLPEPMCKLDKSPCMGIQMALRSGPGGVVTLKDPIYVA